MQLLLTTSSLREQRATTILIKTGIQGTAIYRVSMQNAYCICVQELMPPTVVQQSKGSKLKGKDNTPYSEVSPPKSTCTVCVCLFVYMQCSHTCCHSASWQFYCWNILCDSRGSLYPEFNPVELYRGPGSTFSWWNIAGPGRKTTASCCLQLEDTLLHSFGYSQIKSFPA